MAPDLDPDERTHHYHPQYHHRSPHLLPLRNHHHHHQHQLPLYHHHQMQLHQHKQQIREPLGPNSAVSLPPLSSRNDSSPLQPLLSRQTNRHNGSSVSRHEWQASLKQDGSSVSQAVTAGKDSDLEAAELSHAGGGSDMVRQKYLGQLSIELNRKINKRKNMTSGNPIRVCRFCLREFPSGRALGGHMRVHGALFAGTVAASLTVEADGKDKRREELISSVARSSSSRAADYLTGNSNSTREDRNSLSKELRLGGSDFRSCKALLFGESVMEELGTKEDERSERVSVSSQTNSDDDQYIDDEMIPSSQHKEHSLGSLEFTSNHEPRRNDEVLDDGIMNSEGTKNPLYRLRRNPKRSRRFTDQEFSLEVLAANPAIAFSAKRSGSASPERARPCSECGKVFWSWKALFGHMRCHPEREWRGIQPPESSSLELERAGFRKRSPAEYSFADNSELELESDVENKEGGEREHSVKIPIEEEASTIRGEVDTLNKQEERNENGDAELSTFVKEGGRLSAESMFREFMDDWTPHWPTGKRSRRRRSKLPYLQMQVSSMERALISETTSDELELQNQEDLDMANCLVMLAAAGTRLEELERNRVQTTEESAFSDSGRNERSQNDGPEESEEDVERVDKADLREYGNTLNEDGLTGSNLKYECSTCKRCFNSHQALGGHRASHRKTKGCFARTNPTDELHHSGEENMIEEELISSGVKTWQSRFAGNVEDERAGILHSFNGANKDKGADKQQQQHKGAHECSICHRVFASGQALGGHKRCHWTGDKIADTASVASSNNKQSSLPSGIQTKTMKEEAIDLNLPAPCDEEDDPGYVSTDVAPAYVTPVEPSKDEKPLGAVMEDTHKSNLNGVSVNWAVQNMFKGSGHSLWRGASQELEGTCGFDGRFGIWGQQWSTGAAKLPQMYSMQPL